MGENSHLDAYFSNDGEFQLSTTCIRLHFCKLPFLNKICYQVRIM